MFGNKKTTSDASSDDDIQLTTRSMKSDLEGGSEETLIKDAISASSQKRKEEKTEKNKLDKLPTKEEMPFKIQDKSPEKKEGNKNFNLPTDLPSQKPLDNQSKKPDQNPPEKTHADDFFPPEQEKKEVFPDKKPFPESPKQKPLLPKPSLNTPSKKNYDDFFKDKIKKSPEIEEKSGSSSTVLVVFLVVILLIAVASGAYYYFFILNNPANKIDQPIAIEEPINSFPIDLTENETATKTPAVLENANKLTLGQEEKLRTILFPTQETSESLTTGFYKIETDSQIIGAEELLQRLNISLPLNNNLSSSKAWIYYNNNLTEKNPKIGLVIEIDSEKSLDIKQSIKEEEASLLNQMSGLYADSIENLLLGKKVVFKDSLDNFGFRYFNLDNTAGTDSLDWGVVNNEFLVFATSKEMANEISTKLQDLTEIETETIKDVVPSASEGSEIMPVD